MEERRKTNTRNENPEKNGLIIGIEHVIIHWHAVFDDRQATETDLPKLNKQIFLYYTAALIIRSFPVVNFFLPPFFQGHYHILGRTEIKLDGNVGRVHNKT